MSNPPPTILVIFGASGDLTARKFAPAIFNLSKDNLLPENCHLIGVGEIQLKMIHFVVTLRIHYLNIQGEISAKKSGRNWNLKYFSIPVLMMI